MPIDINHHDPDNDDEAVVVHLKVSTRTRRTLRAMASLYEATMSEIVSKWVEREAAKIGLVTSVTEGVPR